MTSERADQRLSRQLQLFLPAADADIVADMLFRRGARDLGDTADGEAIRRTLVRSANALAKSRGLQRFPASDALKRAVAQRLDARANRILNKHRRGQRLTSAEGRTLRIAFGDSP